MEDRSGTGVDASDALAGRRRTGYTHDALGHHGVLDPEIILLSKPFTPDSLMRHLRRALDASAKRD